MARDKGAVVVPIGRPPIGRWLVLALCPRCVERTGYYCPDHAYGNWWLTNWGGRR